MIASDKWFKDYLEILDLKVKEPDKKYLGELIFSHLTKIPFENISKIYYKTKYGLKYIPDAALYLDGLKKYHFGGTCYANNFYFNLLLKHLGFNVKLCGADMSTPDVHIVNVVETEDTEYLVDVGYASPFFEPLPLNLTVEYEVSLGNEKYILYPKDENGSSKLEQYRNDELIHGYTVKPKSRSISEFDKVIKASYNNDATFMNSLLIVLFGKNSSRIINNLSYIEVNGSSYSKRKLFDKNELVSEVEKIFHIPEEIVEEVVKEISYFGDAWH